jgi:hypothetical protein
MRRVLLVLVFGAAYAIPAASFAQVPRQDSVSLSGIADAGIFSVSTLTATSGPSGENPSGQVGFTGLSGTFSFSLAGPVTCVAVSGNTATLNFQDQGAFGITTVQVTDNRPDFFDAALLIGRAPTDCSPLAPTGFRAPVNGGEITVVDAPPLPTSKAQCKHGGWRSFGVFGNQGDCLSFVATEGRNPPAGSP